MPSPEENSDAVISPFNDVQENVRRFNEDETVWRCFARKRKRRKQLLRLLDPQPPLTEKQLDDLDWLAAERETRPVRAIGTWIAPSMEPRGRERHRWESREAEVSGREWVKSKPLVIQVEDRILLIRGQKVMLDADLAMLYGVEARSLNQAVARNRQRFPADFMFQLSDAEYESIRSQFVTTLGGKKRESSQSVMSSRKHRGRRYRPYAFTEQGVAMLSGVLRSPRAVGVNIAIMRAFVRLRVMLMSNADLARKLLALENKYDAQFRVVFDAIRELMEGPPPPQKPRIGFRP